MPRVVELLLPTLRGHRARPSTKTASWVLICIRRRQPRRGNDAGSHGMVALALGRRMRSCACLQYAGERMLSRGVRVGMALLKRPGPGPRRAVGALIILVASASLASCSFGKETTKPPSAPEDRQPGSSAHLFRCDHTAPSRVLPKWAARAGFSGPAPRAPYILGSNGRIAAVLFGQPFTVPPRTGHNNKILWVARRPPKPVTPLRIDARLSSDGTLVTREVPGGPGPSVVDLPAVGCWHLTLRWSHQWDSMNLRYRARPMVNK